MILEVKILKMVNGNEANDVLIVPWYLVDSKKECFEEIEIETYDLDEIARDAEVPKHQIIKVLWYRNDNKLAVFYRRLNPELKLLEPSRRHFRVMSAYKIPVKVLGEMRFKVIKYPMEFYWYMFDVKKLEDLVECVVEQERMEFLIRSLKGLEDKGDVEFVELEWYI